MCGMMLTGRADVAQALKKSLQSRTKRSRNRNLPKAQVEVQINSRVFRDSPLDAARTECIIAAHAARA
jgi:hypothetical protein